MVEDKAEDWQKLIPVISKVNQELIKRGWSAHVEKCNKLRAEYLSSLK